MMRIQSDAPSPGQDMASEATELASKIYKQSNTLTTGNEVADASADKAVKERNPDNGSRRAVEIISASFLKGRAAEKATNDEENTS